MVKNTITQKLGLSLMSSMGVSKHFLSIKDFAHTINALPYLMNFFERGCQLIDINRQIFSPEVSPVVPEFLLWAMTGAGILSVRRCYEVLETYGDTVLKLAATLLAFWLKKDNARATEGDIENAKGCFVTNFHTFRVGYHNLKTHRFMKIMRDPEPKEWEMPL
jgi:hypothetical protein